MILNQTSYSLEFSTDQLNGQSVNVVVAVDHTDEISKLVTHQRWYFDPATSLPLQVISRAPFEEEAGKHIRVRETFSGYQAVSNMAVPFNIGLDNGGGRPMAITLSNAVCNTGIDPGQFDLN